MFVLATLAMAASGCDDSGLEERSVDIADYCEPAAEEVVSLVAAPAEVDDADQADDTDELTVYRCEPDDFAAFLEAALDDRGMQPRAATTDTTTPTVDLGAGVECWKKPSYQSTGNGGYVMDGWDTCCTQDGKALGCMEEDEFQSDWPDIAALM